jgi:exodeoxyribonuclease V beta subunit
MRALEPLDVEAAPLSGVTLIEASAGTGKTYTIATLFVRLLLEAELPLSEILVVTYTRAATAELRLRIRARLGQVLAALEDRVPAADVGLERTLARARAGAHTARYKTRVVEALRSFDEAAIFTIHGFCQRVLKKHAFESGVPFEAELREDQGLLLEEIVSDYWAAKLSGASEHFVAALEQQKVDIARLVNLVRRAAANPELVVIPDTPSAPSVELEHAFELARSAVAELWQHQSSEIEALLAKPGMHQGSYNSGRLRSWFNDVLPRAGSLAACDLRDANIALLTPDGLRCNKGYAPPQHAFFDACSVWLGAAEALSRVLNVQVSAFQRELLGYARSELLRRSEEAGTLGFDDLLQRLSAALNGAAGDTLIAQIRSLHRAALIDEFQDTDPLQCAVFRSIYTAARPELPAGSLFLIGDPKQAIYAFRGADVFAYMAAARGAVDHAFTLSVNRRSDPSLLRAVDALFARARAPFVFPEIQYRTVSAAPDARDRLHGAGAVLELLFFPRQEAKGTTKTAADALLPGQIANEIARLLAAGADIDGVPVEARHIAVLCRTNAQAQRVQSALRELTIPSVLDGDASVFDSPMAEELSRWLWALCEPADATRVRAALATSGIGVDAEQLLSLEQDESSWDGWVSRFHALHELWHTHSLMRALHALCDELAIHARLLALPDGERRYTDLLHLAELLHAEAMHSRKGPRALLDWYRRLCAGEAQREGMASQDVQIRLESDARAVTLTTIHKSKGLQFPIVYCPFAWDGGLHQSERDRPQFHDREHGDRLTLVLTSREQITPAQLAAAEREALAEQLRLLYVALTRAEHRLSVVWGALGEFKSSALAYLLHQPDAGSEETLREATLERAKLLSDTELLADLARVSAAAGGAIEVRSVAWERSRAEYAGRRQAEGPLAARSPRRQATDSLQVSSFSRLAAGEHERAAAAEGLDRDEHAEVALADDSTAPLPGRVALADFPAGAAFGHLIHAIYETADFQVSEASALHADVESALRDFGAAAAAVRRTRAGGQPLTAADWKVPLADAVFDSLHAPLSPAGGGLPTLASVPTTRRLCELEFLFPVANDLAGGAPSPLSAARIAQLLLAHAQGPRERAYAARLGSLRFAPFRGFLRGFVDLVVEHDGRFYVIDYKSNQLGPSELDYQSERLGAVMRRHHYVLQYLVYSVALHRYLTLRLSGYDYERHFGGVYYLFVRGLGTRHAPGTGVFFDRPERALIERLSALFAQPGLGL